MTAQAVGRGRGRWTFGTATLRARGTMRTGVLHTDAGEFALEATDRDRVGVVARADGRPVVALHPDGSRIPGPGGPARWSLGRHSGTLTRGADRIHVRTGWPGSPPRVEITGTWAERELVVLTACFAVLSRRRRRMMIAIAIAIAARPGG